MARLLLVVLLVQTALFAARPAVTYRTLDLGGDAVAVGVVAGAFGVVAIGLAVPSGRWVDRHGERSFVSGGAAVMGLACAASLAAPDVGVLAASQVLLGAGHIVTVVGAQAWVGNRARPGRHERDFTWLTIAVSLASVVGPALLGSLTLGSGVSPSATAVSTVLGVAAVCALLGAVVATRLAPRPRTAGPEQSPSAEPGGSTLDSGPPAGGSTDRPASPPTREAIPAILRTPAVVPAMTVSVAGLGALDLLTVYLPVYGQAVGLTVTEVSLLLTVRAGAAIVSRLAVPVLLRRLGRRTLLVASTALPAFLLAALPLVSRLPILVGLVALVGGVLALGAPLTMAAVSERVPGPVRATALGIRLGANRVGQVALPVVVGAVASALGVASAFVLMAGLLGIGAVAAARTGIPPPAGVAP